MAYLFAQPSRLFKTLKDSGFKSTTYALSELVDNSIDADAKNILISVKSGKTVTKNRKQIDRIKSIAIFDDGSGMEKDVLARCLSLGWGTAENESNKLGKFGFGLKGASISMAERIDIYSWQERDKIFHTYLDYDEIDKNNSLEIPEPTPKKKSDINNVFLKNGKLSDSGTLIIWSNLDEYRLIPKQADTLVTHMENDMCRIFRHFLDDNNNLGHRVNIDVQLLDQKENNIRSIALKPNDPMYLLTPNSVPGFENQQTNTILKTHKILAIDPFGEKQTVTVILSRALPNIQINHGQTGPVSQHYKSNNGISFVREGREIELSEKGFYPHNDTRARWVGLEIQFPAALDDYFGVTNNKQQIRKFKDFSKEESANFDASIDASDSDFIVNEAKLLSELHKTVQNFFGQALKQVIATGATRGKKGGNTGKTDSTADQVTGKIKKIDKNVKTKSEEEAKKKTQEEKIQEWIVAIKKSTPDISDEEARKLAEDKLSNVVELQLDEWSGPVFLDVKDVGNAAVGILNQKHPFFAKFYDYLQSSEDPRGIKAMELLLMALVRAEDVLYNQLDKRDFERIREEWGKYMREFLDDFID